MPEPRVTKESLRAMAGLAGIELSDAKLDELLPQIQQTTRSMGNLDSLDLTGVEPAIIFALKKK